MERVWEGEEVDVEAIELETEDLIEALEEDERVGESVRREQVDLKLEGAIGPETHVYASMAVHLYQRER